MAMRNSLSSSPSPPIHKRTTVFKRLPIALLFVLTVALCARADEVVEAHNAVVIAGHPLATKLGMAVLDSGGSAADALVTVSLALNVTEPSNSGIGGKF